MKNARIKCIVIDDEIDALIRLTNLLRKINGLEIIAKEVVPEKAIEEVISKKPDIVFLGIEMQRMHGFDFVNKIREKGCSPTIIFVTAYKQYAIKAIKKEVFDFLLKPVDIEELTQTIERYKIREFDNSLQVFSNPIFDRLSNREKEILELVFEGLTSFVIGEKLYISKTTVDTHRRNILLKMGVNSTLELISLQ